MKPRPTSCTSLISAQPRQAVPNITSHRKLHVVHSSISLPLLYRSQWHDQTRHGPLRSVNPSLEPVRHASSAAAVATAKSKRQLVSRPPTKLSVPATLASPSTATVVKASEKLNPPPETYPPELNVPARKAGQFYLKYLYHAGKAYVDFYKGGIGNLRATARLAKSLREKAEAHPDRQSIFTRAEWQIVKRSRADKLRLPVFGLILLVLGEWTPLIAIYITPVIPEACRIPAQVKRTLRKAEEKRNSRRRWVVMNMEKLFARDREVSETQMNEQMRTWTDTSKPLTGTGSGLQLQEIIPRSVPVDHVAKLHLYPLFLLSSKLDAYSRIWDLVNIMPPKAVLQWGLRRRLEYLNKDDSMITRDGGHHALSAKEVARACAERGLGSHVLDRSEADMRRDLAWWFRK